ncbi:nuclear transport factor 2 family protein [Ktedonobacter robiniae]|uniref:SnoaL-like domain-containing protein n=1 Tax=Ktedonobacter robiniae TaxID=2778365 RepID=A0ABQ3UWN8_9CHLR|nr:nuclear transport factor 2 family protein [Ktedonobacter robiniae]GHO57251.1 hypothetical protein KSB_57260 [Ktedonobacter robiniae]
MYHFILKQILCKNFKSLSQGDYESVLARFAPDVHFVFLGKHALGANYRDRAPVRAWFQRFYRLLPGIQFQPHTMLVNGWPWNTVVATHFSVETTLSDGRLYHNVGMQFLRLRWGRVVEDYVYEDSEKLATELQRMAQQGVSEAAAPTPL